MFLLVKIIVQQKVLLSSFYVRNGLHGENMSLGFVEAVY